MKMKKRALSAALFSAFAATLAPAASAQTFSNVYVFGDSLSDAGYFRPFFQGLVSQGFPAQLVPVLGRFTTNPGPVWSEIIVGNYGGDPNPSNVAGGTIFAQGGARVNTVPGYVTPPGQPQRSVAIQIGEYLAAGGGAADPNALYTVWAGANDLFSELASFQAGTITQAQLQTNVLAAAAAEIQQIGRLRAAGAQYIVVFALPNVGATPAFAGGPFASAVTQLSAGYNTTLFVGLAQSGLKVIPVDTFTLFSQIVANPAAYGFSNVTTPACGPFPPFSATPNSFFCYSGNLVAPGADQNYAFADSVHPTTAGHRLIAQLVDSMIAAPSQYGLMAEASVRVRAAEIRTITDGLVRHRKDEVGKLGVFVGGDVTDVEYEGQSGFSGSDNKIRAGTVGLTMRASDALTVGVSYGYARNKASMGNNGSYEAAENAWSVFGTAQWGGFYGVGVFSIADLKFNDINRSFTLGTATSSANAKADGSNSSAYLAAGYDFALGRFMIGPVVAVTTQNVEINQFDEAGGGAAGLRIGAQKRKSEVWSVGARASLDWNNWTPWVRVTADQERRDDARFVTATPITLIPTNSSYDVPTFTPDKSWMTTSVGISGMVGRNVGLSVTYTRVDGRSGVKEDGISGIVAFQF
jgi:outer membrane lipase/esterase